jgi:hypothetical protein
MRKKRNFLAGHPVNPLTGKVVLTPVHRDYLPSGWALTHQIINQVSFIFLYVLGVYQVTPGIKQLTAKA